ncbi:hypothetical protein H6F61_04680 [Cyanobacteria bacterium FACHB-472]|nr:hypothetical protein [Cyanobacteria bacterium FACHB-472]
MGVRKKPGSFWVEAKGSVKDFYNSEKLRNRDIRDRVNLYYNPERFPYQERA